MPDSLQHVEKLLEKLKKEKKNLVAAAAVLVLEVETVEIEMVEEKKKGKNYWAMVLVKMIALEGEK